MKNPLRPSRSLRAVLWCVSLLTTAHAAITPTEWRFRQTVPVEARRVSKLMVPAATFDAADASLSDLRLVNASGDEVPYFIDRGRPDSGFTRPLPFSPKFFGTSF